MHKNVLLVSVIFFAASSDSFSPAATRAQLKKYVHEATIFIETKHGTGSGVAFRLGKYPKDKYVLTAYHVVNEAIKNGTAIKMRSHGMPKSEGQATELSGWHVFHDLASIRLPGGMKKVRPLKISKTFMSPGAKVGIYSFPLGEFKESLGYIGGMKTVSINTPGGDSYVPKYYFTNFVQPGSSGGMMVDRNARLVGIVTHGVNALRVKDNAIVNMGGLGTPASVIVSLVKQAYMDGWKPKEVGLEAPDPFLIPNADEPIDSLNNK